MNNLGNFISSFRRLGMVLFVLLVPVSWLFLVCAGTFDRCFCNQQIITREISALSISQRELIVFNVSIVVVVAMIIYNSRKSIKIAIAYAVILSGMVWLCQSVANHIWTVRVYDAGNLQSIGLAAIMYAGDHDDRFPTSLGDLAEESYLVPGRIYAGPHWRKAQIPSTAEDIRAGMCGYVYVGQGLTASEVSNVVIAYSKSDIYSWINFLFADGHVDGALGTDPHGTARRNHWVIHGVGSSLPK